ncbi:MAG: DUF1559 family PulG-like putative transporter [Pirellulaceae bacterium]
MYQHEHGTLPPAYTVNAEGQPLHSWRVLLLPYLGQQELYGKLRLDEPWDSEHNRQFQDAAPNIYQCPSAKLQPSPTRPPTRLSSVKVQNPDTLISPGLGMGTASPGCSPRIPEASPAPGRRGPPLLKISGSTEYDGR